MNLTRDVCQFAVKPHVVLCFVHRHQNQHGANRVRKGSEQEERHNKSAHTDDCRSVRGELVLVQFCELLKHHVCDSWQFKQDQYFMSLYIQ